MTTPSDSRLFMVDECKILHSTCKSSFQYFSTHEYSHARIEMAQTQ